MRYRLHPSPLGTLLLAGSAALEILNFQEGARPLEIPHGWRLCDSAFGTVVDQLDQYFGGERKSFELELSPAGTSFQRKVWGELQRIPWGVTISYAELAGRVGNPAAVRAVGTANGANPIALVIPCHRVIGSDGSLTGYGGGLELKERLLAHEGAQLRF